MRYRAKITKCVGFFLSSVRQARGISLMRETNPGDQPTTAINQTSNSPSQDYSNPDDQPTTNVSHNQQQSFSGPHKSGRSTNYKRQSQPKTALLRTAPTWTIEQPQTSVTINNSPSQDHTNPDDQPTTNKN